MRKVAFAAMMAVVVSAPAAATLNSVGKPIGKWEVFGEADPMTDKKSCIAYYDGDKHVQLTTDSLAVGYWGRGGLKGYTIRFDSDPPLGMALPTRVEEQVDAFLLKGTDSRFARLLTAKRVRVQAVTVVGGLVNDDIDLTDLQTVLAKMKGPDCS
jgi:hypothetical protein